MTRIAMVQARLAGLVAGCVSGIALGQVSVFVDLLSPADDGFDGLPQTIRCVDVFVDVATTDVWTAAGIRVVAENGGVLRYADGETNTPGLQPGLINPGFEHRFYTSLSKPRNRNAVGRFENAGAAIAGGYDPPAQYPTTDPGVLSVAYFCSPPATSGSPSVDGYIARIAVDISGTGLPEDYGGWGVSLITAIPPSATVVLRSVGVDQPFGTAVASFDLAALNGISWALWWIPEPASALSTIATAVFFARSACRRPRSADATRPSSAASADTRR